MKNIFCKLIIVLIFSVIVSCNDFGDTNTDPTTSTSMDPINQLVYCQMRFSGDHAIPKRAGVSIGMPILQQIGGTYTNTCGAKYSYTETYYSLVWKYYYPGILVNIIDAVDRTNDVPEKTNLNAMLRVLKVLFFSNLTDLYGDIPYSEAGKGYIDGNIFPIYDEQEDIYDDFFEELRDAYDQFDETLDDVSEDQYYAGDITKWKKFTNSLRLRLAMRLIKIDPEKAETEAVAAVADGVFSSNSDICMIEHEEVQSKSGEYRGNGMSAALITSSSYTVVNTILDILRPENNGDLVDPRLNVWFRCYLNGDTESTDITDQIEAYYAALGDEDLSSGVFGVSPGSAYVGNSDPSLSTITVDIPGVGESSIGHRYQRRQIANYLRQFGCPAFIMTYSEVELFLAEAKFRGWNVGSTSANMHYKNGIRASLEQNSLYPDALSISDDDITTFVYNKNLEEGNEIEQINTQLYLSLFLNPIEGFVNWRRSGYPVLEAVGTNASTIPRRFQYPLNEKDYNNANVTEAITKIKGVAGDGKDSYLNRVWWDKEE